MSESDDNSSEKDRLNLTDAAANLFGNLTTLSHDPKIANAFGVLGEMTDQISRAFQVPEKNNTYQLAGELFAQHRLADAAGVTKGMPNLTLRDALHGPPNTVVINAPDKYGITGPKPEETSDKFDQAVAELEETAIEYLETPAGRLKRVVRLIVNLAKIGEPASTFRDYALEIAGENVSDEYRDKLARRLYEAVDGGDHSSKTPLVIRLAKRKRDYIETNGSSEDFWTLRESDGMLWLDAVALEWLDEWTNGTAFNGTLEKAREKARNRWQNEQESPRLLGLWTFDEPIPWKLRPVTIVAEHLWEHEDDLEAEWKRIRKNRPAVVETVHNGLEEMAFRDGRTVREQDGPQLQLWDDGDELVAQTPTLHEQQLARVVEQGTEEFRSITGVRLLVHVIRTTHMQFYRDVDDPRVVEVEGGIKALSKTIGDPGSGKSRRRLKNILEAGQRWRREWNGVVESGLWTWSVDDRTGPGQRSSVRIIVGDPLFPQFAFDMPKGKRTLVPIVDIAPLVAPSWCYGPQAAFQQALVRKIVERRKHIPERGGATLSLSDDIWPLADRLNLPQSTMKRVLDRWTSDGDDGPQFLELVDGRIEGEAVYHLADNEKYRRAREFVAETARRSKRASEAGKASAKQREDR